MEIIITGITTTAHVKLIRVQPQLVTRPPQAVVITTTGTRQVVCVNPVQILLPAMPQAEAVELIPIGIPTHVPVTPPIRITSKRTLTG
ncbi:hypothetical protein A2865_02390 [Candidatus Woesebacteria bacterium RIFCSPHIGHO2_01_FULL_39_17]|uniref:Uncharacterized protein n=3 Tax=Candidatus Woeseibacteriota TaxID=1752722 RepID=A0A0G0NER4_9BACT|nr:MAG: hypothetical protein US72_C0009G0041 [Microgenomates group bacterium GW2011_GWC1_38_12]KKQ93929.1 MAG: hypothetical protein UT19_C0006G0057 [Candidatus Woesebacteria bacterium GW2011_GWB1_39_10b]KKR13998.1 MAG: hypothetical protein UT40_C0007G0040 [Candidatus Woesebacteria bacterium GW2011_GWA1_39_21b]OGM23492.1 MAG: hypothetical protein A2865_02390 [Candidatus Woesebacteria bacterium RIFCSPHIGHO2_01_FULL_39_17]OGM64281.1 MAG: hypothetical protein A3A52_03215 [Candidatus Woesebacteria b